MVTLGKFNCGAMRGWSNFSPNGVCRQGVQEVEQQRGKEKQALKQREEEAELRWHSPLRNQHEHEIQHVERPWTIAALSIPEHVAVCAAQHSPALTPAYMPLMACPAKSR